MSFTQMTVPARTALMPFSAEPADACPITDILAADITASIAELCFWNPANADIWADSEGA